jgi:cysteine desulfurase/selenocysteine lyase
MPPFLGGGDMIKTVSLEGSTWNDIPYKFEAGTPNVGGAVGLSLAIDYLEKLGMENVRAHEVELTAYALEKLKDISDLVIYGPDDASRRGGLVMFNLNGVHSHDLASILDGQGIAVRSGHHCTMPVHTKLGIPSSARTSFYIYNTKAEIDDLAEGLLKAKSIFGV